jgi:hexosaminidase
VIFPRLCALAEVLWTPDVRRDWKHFKHRLLPHLKRFDYLQINAARSVFVPEFVVKHSSSEGFVVEISSEYPGLEIRYTLDGARPTENSKKYSEPITITKPTVIHAKCIDPASGDKFGVSRVSLLPHNAQGCQISLLQPELNADQAAINLDVLSNGHVEQGQRFQHTSWAEFQGFREFVLLLNFGQPLSIENISLGFDGGIGRKLYSPRAIQASCSLNEDSWLDVGEPDQWFQDTETGRLNLAFPGMEVQFIRLTISNDNEVFSYENNEMTLPSIFMDEVVIN